MFKPGDTVGVCDSCGTRQTLSELDKDSMTQSANKPLSAEEINVSALLERIFLFLEDGNWKMADKYCERVLDLDPRNAQAYLGKMMAERHVYTKEQLVDCEETFWGDRNFSKALRFGNKEFSSELMDINSQIWDRNEHARQKRLYDQATEIMEQASLEEDYVAAIEGFQEIPEFQDAKEKISICEEKLHSVQIKNQEEKEKREKEQQERWRLEQIAQEEERQKQEKKRKKRIKRNIFICLAAIGALCIYEWADLVFIPAEKYKKALDQISQGEYVKSYEQLISLDDYKDSKQKAKEIYDQYHVQKLKNLQDVPVGDSILFGAYEQDNDTSDGKEKIEWILLKKEKDRALVLSKYVLDCQYYNLYLTSCTWESCSIRKWLNTTFLDDAFDEKEKDRIQAAPVSTEDTLGYLFKKDVKYMDEDSLEKYRGTFGDEKLFMEEKDTSDRVFLLSEEEAEECLPTSQEKQAEPTEYALAQGVSAVERTTDFDYGYCSWWLRSPGFLQKNANFVSESGITSFYGAAVDNLDFGVRPAMWINITAS